MEGAYSPEFRAEFWDLIRWRRDVRRFRPDPVDAAVIQRCLMAFSLAPSVGLSEPWRLMFVETPQARGLVIDNYEQMNAKALSAYSEDKARLYARLKLGGLREAPVQMAVFCDDATSKGAGLGAMSMAETRAYSVVGAVMQFWLALRAEGLGLGWVSILDPVKLVHDLNAPKDWRFIGYLCIGWPENTGDYPELAQVGWEDRASELIVERR